MKWVSVLGLGLLLAGCGPAHHVIAEMPTAKGLPTVISVDGGDSLTLNREGETVQAQIACIETPPEAAAAMNRLRELLPPGQAVQTRIVDDQTAPIAVELFLGNESVGLMLVREGFAAVDANTIGDCAATRSLLEQAQANAQENQLGIWGVSTFDPTAQTGLRPNVWFDVQTEAGTCPATIGLWEFGLGFEGGADHTVVVDTAAIASQPAQITQSSDRRVVYEAPLTSEFANCTGTASSEYLSMYTFRLADGKVQFDLDLTDDEGFREIRFADISASRPYVHWRAAE